MGKFLHHGICFPLEKTDIKENEPSNRLVINSKKKTQTGTKQEKLKGANEVLYGATKEDLTRRGH